MQSKKFKFTITGKNVNRYDARLDQKASSEHNEPSLDVQGRTKFFWSDIVVLGDDAAG